MWETQIPIGSRRVVSKTSHRLTPSIPRWRRICIPGLSTHMVPTLDVNCAGLILAGPIKPRETKKVRTEIKNATVKEVLDLRGVNRTAKNPSRGSSSVIPRRLIGYLRQGQEQR